MNWYVTKIVFRIICGEGNHTAQFDEQLRLIHASDKEEAYLKAFEIGAGEEDSFKNERNEWVQWKFLNVSELYKLPSLNDGAELYSRIRETKNPQHYIDVLNKKAAEIKEIGTHTETNIAVIN
ncbi:MAG: DUF4288 domain-containing protein [Flavitalea sp.]